MVDAADETGDIWALGAMSGTSLDGVDAAMVLTDGETIFEFGPSEYRPYTDEERAEIAMGFGRWPDEPGVADAAEVVEEVHREVLSGFSEAELIGFHGQTLAHDPFGGRTHQAGNGAKLARALDRPVAWDFRSADMAEGGQGAPLAVTSPINGAHLTDLASASICSWLVMVVLCAPFCPARLCADAGRSRSGSCKTG